MQLTADSAQLTASLLRRVVIYCELIAVSCGLAACVPVDQLPPGLVPVAPGATPTAAFGDLEPGSLSATAAHFTIKGYSQSDLEALKLMAENELSKIGNDTGLYSYLASQSYLIVAYRDRDEFLKKTHEPAWSHVAIAGKGLYCYYPDPDLDPTMAHFLMHLVFRNYLGDKAASLKWLDEGLAMNQEVARVSDADRINYSNAKANALRTNRMAFSQMTFFVTPTEEKRRSDGWYQEVESVVSYVLNQGNSLAFAQLLSELRAVEIDQALSDAYPGKFRNLNDLESAWKSTI